MQPTLIIWGDHDQVFPLELANRLKRFNPRLVQIVDVYVLTLYMYLLQSLNFEPCITDRHLGDNAHLVVIKNAGHALNVEKPKEICKHVKLFLVDLQPPP